MIGRDANPTSFFREGERLAETRSGIPPSERKTTDALPTNAGTQVTTMERTTLLGERLYPISRPEERRASGCRPGQSIQKKERASLGEIFNLTDVTLTHKETSILNLGLKCGLKRPINKFNVFIDVHKFMRKMNMKKYFLNKNSQPVTNISSVPVDSGLHNKSLFNPLNGANQQVEVFKGLKLRDFEGLILKKNVNPRHIQEGI